MAPTEQEKNNRENIAKSFGSASHSYKRTDLTVLDLGSGTGFFTDLLAGTYQHVIGLDISNEMLNFAKNNRNKDVLWLQADAHKIPLKSNSVDFIYSNLVIQWFEPLDEAITEMLRVLKPGGLIIFTTLIDGTLHELKSSWKQVDEDQHVIDFKMASELNTLFNNNNCLLIEQKCQDIILEYQNVIHLARELKALGANHLAQKKNRGLSGKDKWSKMSENYKDFLEPSGIYPATYRLFSGLVVKLNT